MLPPTSIETLRYIVVLSEEGSLTRAAERLHISQPQLSRKVKALQTTWGVRLFDRTLSGFVPTDEGRTAIADIRNSIEFAERGFTRARLLHASRRGPLRIGLAPYIHTSIAPLLRRNPIRSERYAGISFESASTPTLVQKVLSGHLHLGFGLMPVFDRDLWVQPVRDEGFCVCLPDAHLLRDRPRMALRELAAHPLIWMTRAAHPRLHDEVSQYLHSVGFERKGVVGANNLFECLEFAAHNFGCGLLPAGAIPLRRSGVLIKPVTDALLRIRTAAFARRDELANCIADLVRAVGF